MTVRTFLDKPVKRWMTLEYHPIKITLEEFVDEFKESLEPFKQNMINLGGDLIEEKYIEQWVEIFLAWMEIEQEKSKERKKK